MRLETECAIAEKCHTLQGNLVDAAYELSDVTALALGPRTPFSVVMHKLAMALIHECINLAYFNGYSAHGNPLSLRWDHKTLVCFPPQHINPDFFKSLRALAKAMGIVSSAEVDLSVRPNNHFVGTTSSQWSLNKVIECPELYFTKTNGTHFIACGADQVIELKEIQALHEVYSALALAQIKLNSKLAIDMLRLAVVGILTMYVNDSEQNYQQRFLNALLIKLVELSFVAILSRQFIYAADRLSSAFVSTPDLAKTITRHPRRTLFSQLNLPSADARLANLGERRLPSDAILPLSELSAEQREQLKRQLHDDDFVKHYRAFTEFACGLLAYCKTNFKQNMTSSLVSTLAYTTLPRTLLRETIAIMSALYPKHVLGLTWRVLGQVAQQLGHQDVRTLHPNAEAITAELRAIAQDMGLKKVPEVYPARMTTVPAGISGNHGITGQATLFAHPTFTGHSPEEQFILRHEMAHFKNNDLVKMAIASALPAILMVLIVRQCVDTTSLPKSLLLGLLIHCLNTLINIPFLHYIEYKTDRDAVESAAPNQQRTLAEAGISVFSKMKSERMKTSLRDSATPTHPSFQNRIDQLTKRYLNNTPAKNSLAR